MNNKQGKVWGFTEELFNKNNVEIHRIRTIIGGYSSKHIHEHKYNMFFIESGGLEIQVWKKDYDLCDVTTIYAGESTIVAPGELHCFLALEDTTAYEVYWVELTKDIIRENCGGVK